MKFTITIESEKDIDSSLMEVYLDIKKKLYIKKENLPKTLTKIDCDCKSETKYCVN